MKKISNNYTLLGLLTLFFSSFFYTSCKSQNSNPQNITQVKSVNSDEQDSTFFKIKHLLPDSAFSAAAPAQLSAYILGKQKLLNTYIDSIKRNGKENSTLFIDDCNRYFDDYQQYLWYKLILKSPKNSASVVRLSFASPYSKLVSVKERLDYFKTFPISVQQSPQGIKTKKILEEYSFNSIGKKFLGDEILWGVDKDGRKINISEIIKAGTKNYLIVFGASYCGPCILQEKNLAGNYGRIDTSRYKIIGLSTDYSVSKWFAYVNKEHLPWQTFVIEKGPDNEILKKLNFDAVPRNFLLDENKLIIDEHTNYLYFSHKIY